jgi:hypothetical protein
MQYATGVTDVFVNGKTRLEGWRAHRSGHGARGAWTRLDRSAGRRLPRIEQGLDLDRSTAGPLGMRPTVRATKEALDAAIAGMEGGMLAACKGRPGRALPCRRLHCQIDSAIDGSSGFHFP